MEKTLVVGILINKYKKEFKEDVPEQFKLLSLYEKITLLKKSLEPHINMIDLL